MRLRLALYFALAILFSVMLIKLYWNVSSTIMREETDKEISLISHSWPQTLPDAVVRIIQATDENQKKVILHTPVDQLNAPGSEWGKRIRDDFGLNSTNDVLLKACVPDGGYARDDVPTPDWASIASGVILKEVQDQLRKRKFAPNQPLQRTPPTGRRR